MTALAQERAPSDPRNVRTQRIDAVIICRDDALLIELGPVVGNRFRTHTVDSPADIASTGVAARWLGLIDEASLADARGAIARLELQFPRCPMILLAEHPEEWAAAVARGALAAAVPRAEPNGPRMAEALTAAETRLHGVGEPPGTAGSEPRDAPRGGGIPLPAWAGIGAVVLAALGAGGWWWLHHTATRGTAAAAPNAAAPVAAVSGPTPARAAAAATGTAAAPAASRPQSVLELLSAARVAFGDQKLLLPRTDGAPRGDSALELYTQVLAQDPHNDEALDGVRRLFALGKARIQGDLNSGRLDDASRLIGFFRAAGVSAQELQPLQTDVNAARPRWAAQHVQQSIASGDLTGAQQQLAQLAASGAPAAQIAQLRHALDAKKFELQLTAMARQVNGAIAAGMLLDPPNDNAMTRLAAMRMAARNDPVTQATTRTLQATLLQHAQQATLATRYDEAQRYLDAAGQLGNTAQVAAERRELQTAMSATRRAAAAAAAAATAKLKAQQSSGASQPARPSATATTAEAVHYIAARPTRPLHVSYPDGTSAAGSVIVEFTLEPDGSASDATVVRATPPKVFDRTALDAVLSGRYDTRQLVDGEPARARILLRFKPN